MADTETQWRSWARRLAEGDEQVVGEFWRQYGPRLERLAAKHVSGPLRRREDPDDIVQSVCRTFLRRARSGQFDLPDRDSLWPLLCAITLTKVREKERFHRRKKRSLTREQHPAPDDENDSLDLGHLRAADPTPEEAAEFAEELEGLVRGFDEEKRAIIELKLQQCTDVEIAERLHCSVHSVRRILKRVQQRLQRILEKSD